MYFHIRTTNIWLLQDVFVKKLNIFLKITIRHKNYKSIIQQQTLNWKNINNIFCKKILKNIQKEKWSFFNDNTKFWIEILILKINFSIILNIKKFSVLKIISNTKNINALSIFKIFFVIFIIEILLEKKFRKNKYLLNFNFSNIIIKINYHFFKYYFCKTSIRRYISNLNWYFRLNSLEIFIILFFILNKKIVYYYIYI
jgi:hypothetical protein